MDIKTVRRRGWLARATVPPLLAFAYAAMAQTPPWLDPQSPKERAREAVRDYFSQSARVESADVKAFPHGGAVSRWISVSGDLTPHAPVTPEPGEDGQARALARAFLQEHAAAAFDVPAGDIRVERVAHGLPGDKTQQVVNHRVFVGDIPLRGARVQIELDGDSRLTRVNAHLPPITPAMRSAASRATLDEQFVRRLVQADIEADARSPGAPHAVRRYVQDVSRRPTEAEKVMTPTPPYVVWEVRSIWRYDIDAFTGKILSKTPGWADAR